MAEIMILLAIGFVALKAFGSISDGFVEVRAKFAEVRAKESDSKLKLADAERKSAEAEEIRERTRNIRRKVDADVVKSLAESKRIVEESKYRAVTGQHAVVIDNRTGRIGQYIAPPKRLLTQDQPQQQIEDGPNQTAIDVGLEIDRAFVWGPTRGGKTFFCKQLSSHLIKRGDIVFAIDTKDFDPDDPWPGGVQVVGEADNFDEIARFWDWVDAEKARRGKDMRAAKRMPKIYIIFDEINDAVYERPEFADKYIRVLRKYAQYRINIICVGQTDTVDSIGLKGLNQLKKCFDVTLGFQKDRAARGYKSYVDYGDGKWVELIPYRPVTFGDNVGGVGVRDNIVFTRQNGAFSRSDSSDKSDGSDRRPIIMLPAPANRKYQSVTHKEAVEAYLGGRTPNWICANVLKGRGRKKYKPNSRDYTELKRILSLYGIEERRG